MTVPTCSPASARVRYLGFSPLMIWTCRIWPKPRPYANWITPRPNQTTDDTAPYLIPSIMRASAMRSTSTAPSVIIMLRWSRKNRSIGNSFDRPMPP